MKPRSPGIRWARKTSITRLPAVCKRRLQKAVPYEAHLWCNIKNVISEGQPYREILHYAERNEIDLVCIGAQGTGFGLRSLFGSNVDRVLRQAPCPVLVARPLKHSRRSIKGLSERKVVTQPNGSKMMTAGIANR